MAGRMFGDAGEHIGEPGLWIHVVQAGCLDHRVKDSSPLAAAIGAAEQPKAFRPRGTQRSARSAALLVRQTRPSSRKRVKAPQRRSM